MCTVPYSKRRICAPGSPVSGPSSGGSPAPLGVAWSEARPHCLGPGVLVTAVQGGAGTPEHSPALHGLPHSRGAECTMPAVGTQYGGCQQASIQLIPHNGWIACCLLPEHPVVLQPPHATMTLDLPQDEPGIC